MSETRQIDADTIVAIVRKLSGPIHPTGEHHADTGRLGNIRCFSAVAIELLDDLLSVSIERTSHMASVAAIGKYASDTIAIIEENAAKENHDE